MLPASSQPPSLLVREEKGSTSVYFVTESIMPQNTEHPPQLIKIPDWLHFIPHEKSRDRGVFLFQREKREYNVNLKHLIGKKELKCSLTNWLPCLLSSLPRGRPNPYTGHRRKASRIHAFGPLMHFLTQTPNGILQSNTVIYWGMQDLKNTTKIP